MTTIRSEVDAWYYPVGSEPVKISGTYEAVRNLDPPVMIAGREVPATLFTLQFRQGISLGHFDRKYIAIEAQGGEEVTWVYGPDFSEDMPGSARPPWALLYGGLRFIPTYIMDPLGLWAADGSEVDPAVRAGVLVEAVLADLPWGD